MALAFVKEVASVAATNSTNPQVLTVPAGGVAAGNLMVLTAGLAAGSTISSVTDSGGNSWTVNTIAQDDRIPTNRFLLCYAVATTGLTSGNTISITSSNTGFANRVYMVSEYSGTASASVLDKTVAAQDVFSGPNTMDTGNTATTTQADEVLVAGWAYNSTSNTITGYSSGYTGLTTLVSGLSVAGAWRIVAATGAYNATATQSGTVASWGAGLATYKAATTAATATAAIVPTRIPNRMVGPTALRYQKHFQYVPPTPPAIPAVSLEELRLMLFGMGF